MDKPVATQGCPEMSDFSSVIAPLATPPKRVARGGGLGERNRPGEATNRSFIGGGFVPQALPEKGSKSRGFILGVSAANGTSEPLRGEEKASAAKGTTLPIAWELQATARGRDSTKFYAATDHALVLPGSAKKRYQYVSACLYPRRTT